MSERPRRRKKHMVSGHVSQIQKHEEVLGNAVGENTSALKRLARRIRKERYNGR